MTYLLSNQMDIASTHALFRRFDEQCKVEIKNPKKKPSFSNGFEPFIRRMGFYSHNLMEDRMWKLNSQIYEDANLLSIFLEG